MCAPNKRAEGGGDLVGGEVGIWGKPQRGVVVRGIAQRSEGCTRRNEEKLVLDGVSITDAVFSNP